MARFSPSSGLHVEYLILVEPRPAGPSIGFFQEKPIPAAVVDYFGRRYVYAGVASRLSNGRYDIDALSFGERLVEPGLVYRLEFPKPPRGGHRAA